MEFTKPQQEWIDWAIDGMDDDELYPDGPPTFEQALADPETVTDLLYRLEVQAQDMAEGAGYDDKGIGAFSEAKAAMNAAKKIRKEIDGQNL